MSAGKVIDTRRHPLSLLPVITIDDKDFRKNAISHCDLPANHGDSFRDRGQLSLEIKGVKTLMVRGGVSLGCIYVYMVDEMANPWWRLDDFTTRKGGSWFWRYSGFATWQQEQFGPKRIHRPLDRVTNLDQRVITKPSYLTLSSRLPHETLYSISCNIWAKFTNSIFLHN